MIDSYSFGSISVDGRIYHKDLIILPDRSLITPWWRKSGHLLIMSDIEDILKTSPDFLIIGTGSSGLMKLHPSLSDELKAKGVQVLTFPTETAVEKYNLMSMESHSLAACFHLTC